MLLVDFINVGYGDAILLRELEGATLRFAMLVDCGDVHTGAPYPGSRRTGAAAHLRALGVQQLDLLVLSHLHLDHVGGLPPLLALPIREVWTNYLPAPALWGARPQQQASYHKGVNSLIHALEIYLPALERLQARGTILSLQQQPCATLQLTEQLRVLVHCAPATLYRRQDAALHRLLAGGDAALLGELDAYINDTSIRLHISYGGHVLCLPGDATAPFWAQTRPPRCDVLKIPHHGHADSINEALLDCLRPSHAIISVSNDRTDDCPSKSALQLLQARVPNVSFTDAVALPGQTPVLQRTAVQLRIDDGGIHTLPV